jgi:hypothetical protein
MTMCVAECCGIDAYDIHPIHVASYLLLYRGAVDHQEVDQLRAQITSLETNYGSASGAGGVTLEDLNQAFSEPELDGLVRKLRLALDQALVLISQAPE